MKLLLDTHAFLWFIDGNRKMSDSARLLIEDPNNQSLVSIASLWEMAIKISLRKLDLGQPFDRFIPQQLIQNGFGLLPIGVSHVAGLASLPYHHRDPFDRVLIAQAAAEQLSVVSHDVAFDAYGVNRLW
jgi:PIN domain nuclease of toxin-antitoxin system